MLRRAEALGFLLLVSLVVSTALAAIGSRAAVSAGPAGEGVEGCAQIGMGIEPASA